MHFSLYKILLYITFILLFIPAFALPIVINNFGISVFFVAMIATILYGIIFHFDYINKSFTSLLKFNATKFFLFYFVWLCIISLIHILYGNSTLFKSFLSVSIRFITLFCPFFIGYLSAKYFKSRKLFFLLYIILWGVFLWSIFDFLAFYLDSAILKTIFNFIINKRLIMWQEEEIIVFVGNFPRIQAVFEEPCHFAAFIGSFLPFIYKISFSKIKITKFVFFDKVLKISMPILAWGLLIGTFSPIYLIINTVITIIYVLMAFGVKFRITLKNTFVIIFLFLLLFYGYQYFIQLDLNSLVLLRIQSVLKTFTDINLLILAEQSLGRRLIDIINSCILFIKNPILGVGPSSLNGALYLQILHSPVITTPEVEVVLLKSPYKYRPTPNIFFNNLPEIGIIGIFFLYSFFIWTYKSISNALKYLNGDMYIWCYGLKYFVLLYIIFSFYDSQLYFPYGLTVFGAVLGVVYNLKKKRRRLYENNNS